MRHFRYGLGATLLALANMLVSAPAAAALGQDETSVEADRVQMHAAAAQRGARNAYSVHELALPSGTVVREFVAKSGTVFAVAWRGPAIPDLRQLLGAHFATYAGSPQRARGGRGHLRVQDGALVVESSGRSRAGFRGRAYLHDALPAGVQMDEIQ